MTLDRGLHGYRIWRAVFLAVVLLAFSGVYEARAQSSGPTQGVPVVQPSARVPIVPTAPAPPFPAPVPPPSGQGIAVPSPRLDLGTMQTMLQKEKVSKPDVNPEDFNSLFFTFWQHSLLEEARRRWTTRAPTRSELESSEDGKPQNDLPRGVRELSLGGIVYKGVNDWTVWLNGERLTPSALPKQVLDIKVFGDHIDLKWFDEYQNLVYPIRLRPYQRFNLDARIFLPGMGDQSGSAQAALGDQ